MSALLETHLPGWPAPRRGKVRDVYSVGEDQLLIVATDRLSAFDVVMPNGIPGKGKLLTEISLFWFDFLRDLVPNHLITADVDEFPAPLRAFRDQLEGRSMLVRKARMVDYECVARGYLSGSGWKDYRATGAVCGITLPAGLVESDRLPEPIFTPATKAQSGHDENVSFASMEAALGADLARRLRDLTLAIYRAAAAHAESCGIILADTKFEFGFVGDALVLADEALTPDSSRFWPRAAYKPGGAQPSFDKQFVRDWLEAIQFNKKPPGPVIPDDVVAKTLAKYEEAVRLLKAA
jgi:phosphoribosylaminoimidazole-succinocarboxamide synthase